MEFSLRILKFIFSFLEFLLRPVFWYKLRKEPLKLPPNDNKLLRLSATKLAEKIRRREVSSVDVVQAYINRIKEVNPIINAIVEERFDAALQEAQLVDNVIIRKYKTEEELKNAKPLLGVPVTIKESCGLAGHSLAVGSLQRRNIKATVDGDAVALLKASGAIPIAITNTPEICLSWDCSNFITGATSCPYNTNYTSGGSSGGEGAILGAGASVIGVGTDLGGSIRIPALFNGVFGHKPTSGIVSPKGTYPYSDNDEFNKVITVGPLTRYAEDLKPMLQIMAGENAKRLKPYENVPYTDVKVYYMEEASSSSFMPRVDDDVKECVRKCMEHLRDNCKANIFDYPFPELAEACEIGTTVLLPIEGVPKLLEDQNDPKKSANLCMELLKTICGKSNYTPQALTFCVIQSTNMCLSKKSASSYLAKLEFMKRRLKMALMDNGVLLYPTLPFAAMQHDQIYLKLNAVGYTLIFNVLGFPVTHVPLGLNKKGLPIGISVISAPNNDYLCLKIAEELEKQFGGWVPPV